VDVMIRRWQEHSGKEATLEGDGRSFRELEAERIPAVSGSVVSHENGLGGSGVAAEEEVSDERD
jgi:hypothetical protein